MQCQFVVQKDYLLFQSVHYVKELLIALNLKIVLLKCLSARNVCLYCMGCSFELMSY